MRKLLLSLVVVLFSLAAIAQQAQVIPLSAGETMLEMRDVNPESFNAKLSVMELSFETKNLPEGDFSYLSMKDGVRPNNVGQANLPVISKMIEIPYGAEIQVVIESYNEEVINLSDYGIEVIEPTQPSYSKSTPADEMVFVMDELYYTTDVYETTPLVKTEIHGIMRGMRVGRIEIRPYHYNPVENTLIVYNNLEFSINFVGADLGLTEEMKSKYYSNEFDGAYTSVINYNAPATKDAFYDTSNPVKYVIVANTFFQSTLQPFVEWKTRQGYNVIEYYVSTGTSNTSIKTYLEGLYDAASASDPAPLYVLIVGDHGGNYSIPAFDGDTGSHVTDVYFATYDGGSDYLPDLYMGRLSCNTTTELQNALDKILPYEQYTMPSTSHLDNAVLVAGVDPDWGPTTGDASVYYWAEYFVNEAHGFSNIYAYYQNEPSGPYFVGDSDDASADDNIIANITSGIGYANYTAHCYELGWADPSIVNSDISSFNNLNEYPFMIGNCCLSFKFDYDDSFGENLLQTANEGAVGYIGTSNNSQWHEDFYWGVGTTSLDYTNESNVGDFSPTNTDDAVYDALFHETGQSFSEWYYTASQIVYSGNMAVQGSTSGYKQYYWEIYHTSGDPSLMPYMSEPNALSLSFPNPMVGATTLVVTTEPYTYVALSKDNVLIDAKWSGAGTSVTLTTPAFSGDTYCVVGTKQDRSPYINESIVPTATNPPVADFSGTPTTILEGQSVTFTDLSQYAVSYLWNFGDGQTSTDVNPVHIYTTANTYTVVLTVTNPIDSDTETKTNYITVNPNTSSPIADFVASETVINVNGSVDFTDLSIDNPTDWYWEFEGGIPATSDVQDPTGITYNSTGTFKVKLTATNVHGFDVEEKLLYIAVTAPEPCAASGDDPSLLHITNFTYNTIDNDSGDSQYSDFTGVSTDVVLGDTYSFNVGLSDAYSFNQCLIWVDWNCDGDFDDVDENVYTSAIGGAASYSGNIQVSATANLGLVRLRIRQHYDDVGFDPNATPCGTSGFGEVEDYTLNIVELTLAPVADFTANTTTIGVGGSVNFIDLSTNVPDSWLWSFEGAATASSVDQDPVGIVYNTIGTYQVSLTVSNEFGPSTETKLAYINVIPAITAFDLDFEPCTDFQVDAFAPWTTYDGDGEPAYGSATYDFDNEAYTGSFIAFNSTQTTPSAAGTDFDPHGGERCGVCFSANNSTVTDDWLISPVLNLGNNSSLEFWAKTYTDQWGFERFVVYVSTTDDAIGSFTKISAGTYVEAPEAWTEYTYDLSAYDGTDIYVAIQCVSDDAFAFMIDDILINTEEIVASPVADFSASPTNGCETLLVNFTDLSTGVPSSWSWDFGDGGSSSDPNPSYTYTAPGTYSVELTVTNAVDSDDITYTDFIVVGEMPSIDAPADVVACDSYTLTALSGGDYYTTTGGVGPIAFGTPISTDQTIYVWEIDATGNCEAENSFTVTINTTPSVDAPANLTECGSYILPALTDGDYYENTGGVNPLAVGYEVTSDMTIYVYEETGTTPNCFDENSFTVTILTAPVIDNPANVAACETYTLPVLTNGDYYSNADGVGLVAAGTPITGTTTIYIWDTNGTCDSENSFTVTIDDMPMVDAPDNVEECGSYVLPALTNGAYFANTGGVGPIAVGTPIAIDQTIYVYATNGTCDDENSFDVTIFEEFTLSTSVADESAIGANDGSITVNITGGTPDFDGTWSAGSPTSTSGTSMIQSGLTGGTYAVTVVDVNGCMNSIGATVGTVGAEPIADFEADITEGCGTLTVNFTDLSLNAPTFFVWNFGDGETSNDPNPTHTYDAPGLYTVTLFVENADGDDNTTMLDYIEVFENPEITVDVIDATGAAVADGSATVIITGGTGPFDITWSNSDSGETITGLLPANYSVIVEDAHDCIATTPFVVNWYNFTEISEAAYSIYPNPTDNILYVQFDDQICETIEIYDMLGQIVTKLKPSEELVTVDVSNMISGVYFVKVIFSNKEFTHKLVVK